MNEIDEVIYSLRRRRGAIVERIEAMDHAIAALRAVDEMDSRISDDECTEQLVARVLASVGRRTELLQAVALGAAGGDYSKWECAACGQPPALITAPSAVRKLRSLRSLGELSKAVASAPALLGTGSQFFPPRTSAMTELSLELGVRHIGGLVDYEMLERNER